MRLKITFAVAAGALVLALGAPAQAFDRENPDGVGIYSPLEPPVRGRERALRYDPRSWYYTQRGYYPNYSSNYWVPRAEMRYRYRSQYRGPKYHYYPAWGFPVDW
jgi:hypothetical protein